MNSHKLWLIITMALISGGISYAESFSSFGPRSLGMGNAFCSVAGDPSAIYWNPSLLILRGDTWNVSWTQGEDQAEKAGFIDDLRAAIAIDPTRITDPEQLGQLAEYLDTLDSYKAGAYSSDHLAFAFHHKRTAFMIVERQQRQAALDIDLTNVAIGDDAINLMRDNDSALVLSSLRRTEFITSYAYVSEGLGLLGGVNLKYIQAKSYLQRISLWDLDSSVSTSSLLDSTTDEGVESSSAFSWDLAFSAVVGSGNLSICGRDLTGYTLERKDEDAVEIEPSYRIGYSTQIANNMLIAVDYDLTANRDQYSNESDRNLAWGMEKWFGGEKGICIRGGFIKPLGEDSNPDYIFSAGLGFRIKWLNADVGGMMDSDRNFEGLSFQVLLSFE